MVHEQITWGVGISMGSVPPDVGGNCIANVFVKKALFHNPLKAIYIKPNPAKYDEPKATGTIANVTYEDIEIHDPLWWSIWIGTQQQHQPGEKSGTGCSFLYPLLNSSCPVPVRVRRLRVKTLDPTHSNLRVKPYSSRFFSHEDPTLFIIADGPAGDYGQHNAAPGERV